MSDRLSFKQLKFVAAYIGEARGNATEAARIAGYKGSDGTLQVVGAENLRKPNVKKAIDEERDRIRDEGIASKQFRIDAANCRHKLMMQVIDERAQEMKGDAPGAGTGLLVRTYRALGSGEFMEVVKEYAVDTALLKELRELEKQIAQEMGDFAVNQNINISGVVTFADLAGIASADAESS